TSAQGFGELQNADSFSRVELKRKFSAVFGEDRAFAVGVELPNRVVLVGLAGHFHTRRVDRHSRPREPLGLWTLSQKFLDVFSGNVAGHGVAADDSDMA